MSNRLEEEVRYLHKRLDQLMQSIEKQVHDRSEDVYGLQDKANQLGKKLRGCCDSWVSSSSESLDQLKSNAQDGAKKLKESAEDNIFISLGVSALVGCLLAFFFSRKK